MRNGNVGDNATIPLPYIRSYPTYEEWKQVRQQKKEGEYLRSYPTYEEWKPGSLSLLYMDTWILVLILPMRNGNKSSSVGSCRQNIVLILPMRNGN